MILVVDNFLSIITVYGCGCDGGESIQTNTKLIFT